MRRKHYDELAYCLSLERELRKSASEQAVRLLNDRQDLLEENRKLRQRIAQIERENHERRAKRE